MHNYQLNTLRRRIWDEVFGYWRQRFLGSYVAKQLLARGDEVVCFDLPPKTGLEETSLAEVLTKDEMEKVKFVGGDITDDKKLVELCKEEKIDMIIHLGCHADRRLPEEYAAGNQGQYSGNH